MKTKTKTKKIKPILKPTAHEQEIFKSGSFGSSTKSSYSSALRRAHRNKNNYLISHIHKQLFKVEKVWMGTDKKRVLGRFKNRQENCYYVDFQENEVICSCLDYVLF